jgi:hypothetical protein
MRKQLPAIIVMLLFMSNCVSTNNENTNEWGLNLTHLNHLYDDHKLKDDIEIGSIAIYADYPDYNKVSAAGEGFSCIDDVARAIVVLADVDLLKEEEAMRKFEALIRFILHLQSANGYFYNFLNDDLSINRQGQTSENRADWWSWRALWALEAAYPFVKENNPDLAKQMQVSIDKLLAVITVDFAELNEEVKYLEGIPVATWLPGGSAADQAAVLILGLDLHYRRTEKESTKILMDKLARGIVLMQHGDENQWPHAALFSWKNIWHAYGNVQAYALLKLYETSNNEAYKEAALRELDHFYEYSLETDFINYFKAEKSDSAFQIKEFERFAQIAYGFRPMVFACLEAYKQTGREIYVDKAIAIAAWLYGNNDADIHMYDPSTGRCFDGLNKNGEINKNSGAESTLEALLILSAFKQYGIKPIVFHKKLKETLDKE